VLNILDAVDIITTGTMLSGYNPPTFNISDGQIEIAFAGSDTLTGQGILLYVQMTASLQHYGGTNINFSDVIFNEDILANTQYGYCYVNQLPTLIVTPNTANVIAGDLSVNVSGGHLLMNGLHQIQLLQLLMTAECYVPSKVE